MAYNKLDGQTSSLEETLDLSSLGIDVDVQVAWSRRQTGNRLNVSSERVPIFDTVSLPVLKPGC